jgi:hypothetical protein
MEERVVAKIHFLPRTLSTYIVRFTLIARIFTILKKKKKKKKKKKEKIIFNFFLILYAIY